MDIDPTHDHLNGPLAPASPGLDKMDELRMSVDGEDNKVKFTTGVREITPHEPDSDGSHQEAEKVISADDCTLPLPVREG